jgi:hypothetical protein
MCRVSYVHGTRGLAGMSNGKKTGLKGRNTDGRGCGLGERTGLFHNTSLASMLSDGRGDAAQNETRVDSPRSLSWEGLGPTGRPDNVKRVAVSLMDPC